MASLFKNIFGLPCNFWNISSSLVARTQSRGSLIINMAQAVGKSPNLLQKVKPSYLQVLWFVRFYSKYPLILTLVKYCFLVAWVSLHCRPYSEPHWVTQTKLVDQHFSFLCTRMWIVSFIRAESLQRDELKVGRMYFPGK